MLAIGCLSSPERHRPSSSASAGVGRKRHGTHWSCRTRHPGSASFAGLRVAGRTDGTGFGIADAGAGTEGVLAQGSVDAVLLHGPHLVEQRQLLAASGAQPLFTLGTLDENGRLGCETGISECAGILVNCYEARADGKARNPLYAACMLPPPRRASKLASAAATHPGRDGGAMAACGADALHRTGVQATGATLGVQLLSGPAPKPARSPRAADAADPGTEPAALAGHAASTGARYDGPGATHRRRASRRWFCPQGRYG